MLKIRVKDIVGKQLKAEDGIIIREMVKGNLKDQVILDFEDFDYVPTTFLCSVFTDLMNKEGRDYIFSHVNVKNLSNMSNYKRVVLGTTF